MMQVSQKHIQSTAVMVIILFSFALCQENERRAVAEHQFMNDRGRTVQSLKRLMWLSNTIEGLHTAQARSSRLELEPVDCGAEAIRKFLSQEESRVKQGTLGSLLQMLWCSVYQPRLTSLPESEE